MAVIASSEVVPGGAMDGQATLLTDTRDAYARRDWPRARDGFRQARARGTLPADDVYALADAAWWLGLIDEALTAYEEAYHCFVQEERPRQAAVTALSIGYTLALRGDGAVGSGWMSRAVRMLRDEPECVEHGYLRYIEVESAIGENELGTAIEVARDLQAMGRRFGDPTLLALGALGEGRALVKQGEVGRGLALLDEAMLAAVAENLDPSWAGNIYCNVMVTCYELGDIRRAGEWTQATARWCEQMPAAGPFMGICRVHRAQILQIHGDWGEAEREVVRVCAELAHFDVGTVAEAHYQLGEVHRLRGDLAAAEAAYRQAHALGRDPQPGIALLRLAQGRADAAAAAIQAALAGEPRNRLARARLCAAQVTIALATGEVERARLACDEMEETAAAYGSSGLEAAALQARGAVLLAENQLPEALQALRAACRAWQRLNAPCEAARTRLLLARAYAALADQEAAARELDAAAAVFDRLGATPDMRAVAELRNGASFPDGLTQREAEVLAEIASGKTNREIAGELSISEKTVARHLSNIFTKLDLTSRTAAAAYAIANGLATRPRG